MSPALTPLANMGQQLFEPPDVGGWTLGAGMVFDGRDARADELCVQPDRPAAQRTIAAAATGKGPTPEALLSFYLDRLTPGAPSNPPPMKICSRYLRGGGRMDRLDAQLRIKAPGLLHLIVGSSEYQLV